MISDYKDSDFYNDVIVMDVMFEQLRAWIRYEKWLTKQEIVFMMRRIQNAADGIERETRKAGTAYFEPRGLPDEEGC